MSKLDEDSDSCWRCVVATTLDCTSEFIFSAGVVRDRMRSGDGQSVQRDAARSE